MTARQYQATPRRDRRYVVDHYLVIGERPSRHWFLNPWLHVAAVLALIVVLFVIVTSAGGRLEVLNP
jgi:Ni,Fe-hydrogenase I cytochrome b subunit